MWNPLIFLALLSALFVLLYLFSRMWNLSYNSGRQRDPFLSGNTELASMQVKAPSLYWGFFEAFKGYYAKMREMHSNSVNDYVYWFVVVLAVVLVLVGVS